MNSEVSNNNPVTPSAPAARVAMAAAGATLLLLAGLHGLSPELDPSWRVVSEYANGRHGWVLSLMFACWALSSWALAVTVWSPANTLGARLGCYLLITSGLGEAMAALFDINHPLHGLAGLLGVPTLPIAAMLISVRLARTAGWSPAGRVLLASANLTWVSVALLVAALIAMSRGHSLVAGPQAAPAWFVSVGWANRFLVAIYCAWVMTVAGQALRLRRRPAAVRFAGATLASEP
jgi:Protein of unknown function (DUF998)